MPILHRTWTLIPSQVRVSTPKMSTDSSDWGSESGNGPNLRRHRIRNPTLS